ncbi:glycosyltransferase family 2 protein [Phocaeicola faecalis]
MENPIISVIIPVYNAEKYLSRCLDSLLVQTLTNFEILIINDGSSDGSAALCDKYASNDSRIRVFHNTNQGVSKSRQFAIEQSTGEFTIHVDSDDWVEPNMLEELYNKIKGSNADMVICDFFVETMKGSQYSKQNIIQSNSKSVLQSLLTNKLMGNVWNKLIRRDCYEKYNVKFPSQLNYCEDYLVCVQLLIHNDLKVVYHPKAFYHYDKVVNGESITRKYTRKTYEQRALFIKMLKEYTPNYLHCQYEIVCEAIARGVLDETEYWQVYKNDSLAMLRVVPLRISKKRRFLSLLFINMRLFKLGKIALTFTLR